MKGQDAMLSSARTRSGSDTWETPAYVYDALDAEFDFGLDAACNSDSCRAPRGYRYDLGEDAFAANWLSDSSGGAVWLNPPYSRIKTWAELAARWAREGCVVVMLIPARTCTQCWHRYIHGVAAEVRLVEGRISFGREMGPPAPFPSAVVIYCERRHEGETRYTTQRFDRGG